MTWLTFQRKGLWFDGGEGGGAGTGDDPGKSGNGDDKKTFTQKELDDLFARRAEQGGRKAVTDLLDKLGLKGEAELKQALADAKALAEEKKKRDEEQLSELDKARKAAADEKARADKAEQERADALARAGETALRAEVLVAASKAGFNDPADAWVHLDRQAVKAGEDGKFEGVEKAVEAVAKAKPYLVGGEKNQGHGTPRLKPGGSTAGGGEKKAAPARVNL